MSDQMADENAPLLQHVQLRPNDRGLVVEGESESDSDTQSPVLTSKSSSSNLVEARAPFDLTKAMKSDESTDGLMKQHRRYKYYSRLAPAHRSSLFIMPSHVVPAPIFVIGGTKGKQSSLVTILSIWNTMMGTSVLAMPWAIQQAGFLTGIFCIILMCFLSLYTCQIVLRAGKGGKLNGIDVEFPDVCRIYLGEKAYAVAVIFGVMTIVGAAMVYWVLMSSFLYTIGDYFHDPSNSTTPNATLFDVSALGWGGDANAIDASNTSSTASSSWEKAWNPHYVPLYLIAILFPLTNFKSITFFTKFNSLGIVSIAYILFFVIYAAANGDSYAHSPAGGVHFHHETEFRSSFLALTGILSLAFFIHNGCLSIMRNQKHPEHNSRDLSLAFIFVALTYSIVGIVYFLAFHGDKSKIHNNFLQDFAKSDGNFVFALVAQIFLLIQMITVFPLLLFISRFQVMTTFFSGKAWPSAFHVVTHNVVIVACCVLIAIFYPSIGTILRYTGALAGMIYVFAFPALVHMEIKRRDGKLTMLDQVLHYGLIVVGLGNVIGQFVI